VLLQIASIMQDVSAIGTFADAAVTIYCLQERRTYEAARGDYVLAMADYECMHNLEITT
jgi:hypothetical protein